MQREGVIFSSSHLFAIGSQAPKRILKKGRKKDRKRQAKLSGLYSCSCRKHIESAKMQVNRFILNMHPNECKSGSEVMADHASIFALS